MKRSKLQWIALIAAVALISAGSANPSSAQATSDEPVAGSKSLSFVGDVSGGVATVSYVGDLPCDGCDGGSCDAGCSSCDGCSSGHCAGGGCGKGCRHGRGCSGGACGGGRSYGRPDLFYNFYTQGNANRTNAQMYLSPLPVPPNVGHTYNTYQPYYPHELLYWHKDKFHNYYDNGRGMNRTRAIYYSPPIRQAASNIYWNYLRLPR